MSKDKSKDTDQENVDKAKALLDHTYKWPTEYTFKFIVPHEKENEVRSLFPYENLKLNFSKKGKYISFTVSLVMESADAVLQVYDMAKSIDGLLAL